MIDQDRARGGGPHTSASDHRKRYEDILAFCEVINRVFHLMERAGRNGVKPLAESLAALAV
jgi:hypothetical protein